METSPYPYPYPYPLYNLQHKHVVLGLSGGIACYKAAELCRALVKHQVSVQVVMTKSAERFITPVTMQALSGKTVYTSQWDARESSNMAHIHLTRKVDMILIAPASADFMARLLHGRADDLLSLMILARPMETVPLILAPAMNREMWAHPATQRNVAQLRADGAHVLEVGYGEQACGETGDGRMLETQDLLAALDAFAYPKLLRGKHVLITAGPTYEPIDPVRGITNLSSGKMGFAVARAALEAGAEVTLIAGVTDLPTPYGCKRMNVRTAQQMFDATIPKADEADVFIATAAVADWRVANPATEKLKKEGSGKMPQLNFIENPDILATVARSSRAQNGQLFCVGFSAESTDVSQNTRAKRLRKGVPLMVGNLGPAAFGDDYSSQLFVDEHGERELPYAPKQHLARQLIEDIALRIA